MMARTGLLPPIARPVFAILSLLVAAVFSLVGILVLRRAWWDRDWRAGIGGALLLAAPLAVLGLRAGQEPSEWTPAVPRAALVGTWVYGHSTLELAADGRFRADVHAAADSRVHLGRSRGSWSLSDWNLVLQPDSGEERRLRVVVGGSSYRIVDHADDPAVWQPWFGFQRQPASRVAAGADSVRRTRTALRRSPLAR